MILCLHANYLLKSEKENDIIIGDRETLLLSNQFNFNSPKY